MAHRSAIWTVLGLALLTVDCRCSRAPEAPVVRMPGRAIDIVLEAEDSFVMTITTEVGEDGEKYRSVSQTSFEVLERYANGQMRGRMRMGAFSASEKGGPALSGDGAEADAQWEMLVDKRGDVVRVTKLFVRGHEVPESRWREIGTQVPELFPFRTPGRAVLEGDEWFAEIDINGTVMKATHTIERMGFSEASGLMEATIRQVASGVGGARGLQVDLRRSGRVYMDIMRTRPLRAEFVLEGTLQTGQSIGTSHITVEYQWDKTLMPAGG